MSPRDSESIRVSDSTRAEREEVRSAVKSAAWTICLLAEVLKDTDVDWIAASELALILEGQAEGLKSIAWRLLLTNTSDLNLQ
jgi:hypothetical protein